MIRTLGDLLIYAAAAPATLSVIVHWPNPWLSDRVSRHLMAYMFVIAAILDLWVIRIAFGDSLFFVILRLAVAAFLPVVLWWRFFLQVKYRHPLPPPDRNGPAAAPPAGPPTAPDGAR
jgi:hypothetical protein